MTATADAPGPETRFRPKASMLATAREVWRARVLVRTLAERDIRVQYKQAALGVAWAVITPVILMVVLTVFVQHVATIDTQGIPYSLYSYVGLVPWGFFSSAILAGGLALINQITLVNKIKCPREVFPLSQMAVAGFNALIASAVLLVLFVINRFPPKPTTIWIVAPLALQIVFTVALLLLISSVVVYLRDLRHALPLLLQFAFFATPVAYGLDAIPDEWRNIYVAVNPMAAALDGYRRAILFGQAPNWRLTAIASVTSLLLLVIGFRTFRRLELGFADMV